MPNTNTHNYTQLVVNHQEQKKRWWVPKSPKHLSDKQYVRLSHLMFSDPLWVAKNRHKFLLQIAQVLVTDRWGNQIPDYLIAVIPSDVLIVHLYPLLGSFVEGVAGKRLKDEGLSSAKMVLKKPTKALRKYRKLFGPGDNLRHVSVAEFIRADTEFNGYMKTGDSGYLHRFIACLYRPRSLWGLLRLRADRRRKFDNTRIEKDARRVAKLVRGRGTGQGFAWAVMANFIACTNLFMTLYPNIYPDKKQEGKPASWRQTVVRLAHADLTKIEGVGKANFHNALSILDYEHEQATEETED